MRGLVQRVLGARVEVAGELVGHIEGPGLLVLVGVTHEDTPATAVKLAQKIYDMRLFDASVLRDKGFSLPDDCGREVSASDASLPVLVVSQFTLYAETKKGRRPTWDLAAPGPVAEPLVDEVAQEFRRRGAYVATGRFGADMAVSLTNDGPMTIIVELS